MLPQAQGGMPGASFQEGRRASDTSLTQGMNLWHASIGTKVYNIINVFQIWICFFYHKEEQAVNMFPREAWRPLMTSIYISSFRH